VAIADGIVGLIGEGDATVGVTIGVAWLVGETVGMTVGVAWLVGETVDVTVGVAWLVGDTVAITAVASNVAWPVGMGDGPARRLSSVIPPDLKG